VIGSCDRGPEDLVLPLDPVEIGALAVPSSLGPQQQHERPPRHQAPRDGAVELEHPLDPEPARDPLVDDRRVDVAVAHHPGAALERRPDHALHVLGSGRRKERRLGPGTHLEAVQHEIPDRLAEWSPAGLPRRHDLPPLSAEPIREQRRLGRLPRSVLSLERDEHLTPTIRRVRAAVTVGAGFIGSNLVDALVARGDEVVAIDDLSFGRREYVSPGATFVERDIRDGVDLAGFDVVFHLAAQTDVPTSIEQPAGDALVNVVGTVLVVEAALRSGAQIVFTSTGGAIYGECDGPALETSPLEPLSPYGIAKLCAEQYLLGWNRIHGTHHVAARLANVYGPRQSASLEGGVVSIFLDRLAAGAETVIYGNGDQTRDFVYVGDVVAGLIAAVGHDGGVFNIGTGEETTVLALHHACAAVAGRTAEPRLEPARLGDVRRSVLDVSRAAAELGWRAETPLPEGLERTWSWMSKAGV
jgi:UDP-glucose 4-epimerase